jgi:hypothetical protein
MARSIDAPFSTTPLLHPASHLLPVFLGRGESMLWTIFAILLVLWLLGWGFHVAGSLIHLLLVVAVIILLVNLITGRRTVV